jgi:hemoglobin
MTSPSDLDNPRAVGQFVRLFYGTLLRDPLLAPLFLEVARIDLERHLPRIQAYWRKLLLGEAGGYNRHTMAVHRQVHARERFTSAHFSRWLELFHAAVDGHFAGPKAERAKTLARTIARNMEQSLSGSRSLSA